MSTLKLKLKKVDPVKYGMIIGATMALVSFIMLGFFFLFSSLFASAFGSSSAAFGMMGGGLIGLIFAPILYFIFGFIFGWIGTVILNFILSKTGGLDLEFEKEGLEIDRIGIE